jgi:hypothetical protein
LLEVPKPFTPTPPPTLLHRAPAMITVFLAAGTAVVLALFVAVFTIHDLTGALRQTRPFVNVNGEANLPAWWNASLLLLVSLGALACRLFTGQSPAARRGWLAVGIVAVVMSLDEISAMHERLDDPVRAAGVSLPTFLWLVPGVVIAGALAAVLLWAGRALPSATRWPLLLAMLCYGGGALGIEAINGMMRDADRRTLYIVGTTFEETVEMGACVLAVAVVADHLCRHIDVTGTALVEGPRFSIS